MRTMFMVALEFRPQVGFVDGAIEGHDLKLGLGFRPPVRGKV